MNNILLTTLDGSGSDLTVEGDLLDEDLNSYSTITDIIKFDFTGKTSDPVSEW